MLIEQRTALVNQLEYFHSAQTRRLVQKVLKNLQAQIEQANQKLKALIAQEAPTAPTALPDPKGRFPTALSLSSLLPEIDSISTKQLAALVGVAPLAHDRGCAVPKAPSAVAEPNFVLNFTWLPWLPLASTPSLAMFTSA